MIKKSLIVLLGMGLFVPNLYANTPFADIEFKVEKETSKDEIVSTDIKAPITQEDQKQEEISFPVKGSLDYDGIRLREWAWGPIIKECNKTELTVVGKSGDFYEVEIDGAKGFLHKNFVSIPNYPSTGKQPVYPGDTWEGGYLSREEGAKYTESSNNESAQKVDGEDSKKDDSKVSDSSSKSEEETTINTKNGLKPDDFNKLIKSMKTPTRDEIIKLAASKGISEDYVKILIGTTQREGYFKDKFLHYGWASAMLNQKVTIKKMQGWDPKHKGDSNYYSQKNINKGYKEAGADVLKSVYLAIKYRNKKIIECNGMYKKTPKSYNMIYKSSKYNCRVYEKK